MNGVRLARSEARSPVGLGQVHRSEAPLRSPSLLRRADRRDIAGERDRRAEEVALVADTLEKAEEWLLSELAEIGGLLSLEQAYTVLHAVLPMLRDRLTLEEAAQLASHLPPPIKGMYYDGWRPADVPERWRTKQDFLARVADRLGNSPVDPEEACRAVFELLERRVAPGEVEDVKQMMHQRVRELWPGA